MEKTVFLAIATLTLSALTLQAARLAGTKLKDYPANPKNHVISIERKAETEIGKKMIHKAETAEPDTGVWWNVKDDKDQEKDQEKEEGNENGKKDDIAVLVMGLKTPYALTTDTLKYYADQIRKFQEKAWKQRVHEPRSKLDYTAKVDKHEAFTLDGKQYNDVYVVTMKMVFQTSFTISTSGGTRFQKERTVVLDTDGKVLAIAGDKEEDFFMWMM